MHQKDPVEVKYQQHRAENAKSVDGLFTHRFDLYITRINSINMIASDV